MIINPRYDYAGGFKDGVAPVCIGTGCLYSDRGEAKWGYVDPSGNEVIPPQFNQAYEFSEGLATVSVGGKFGYIDHQGRFLINPQFDYAGSFQNGFADVAFKSENSRLADKRGYIDHSGKYLWQPSK